MPTPARPTTFRRPLLASNTALVTCNSHHGMRQMATVSNPGKATSSLPCCTGPS